MGLDIRFVIGLMFLVIGGLLTVFGALSDHDIYRRSLDINVNLWWGLVIMAFGAKLLWLSRRGRSARRSSGPRGEGRTVEARERLEGLEREDTH